MPRHVPDQVVRGMNRHIKCFSIKRQKIRDNDQVARGLKKRGAKRQQSTGIYLSSCGAVEKRETNKCSIKKQETTTTGLVIPDHSLMSRQLLDNHPGKKIVDDHPPCGAPSVYVPACDGQFNFFDHELFRSQTLTMNCSDPTTLSMKYLCPVVNLGENLALTKV